MRAYIGFLFIIVGLAGIGGYFDGTGNLGQALALFIAGIILMWCGKERNESTRKRRSANRC